MNKNDPDYQAADRGGFDHEADEGDEKVTWGGLFVASSQVFALSAAFVMLLNDGKGFPGQV